MQRLEIHTDRQALDYSLYAVEERSSQSAYTYRMISPDKVMDRLISFL
ncbi:hypothetical protein [Phormidesmis priestleyi]|nr:hypothetical protein [Phormidesmis priestleyi]